MTGSPWKGEDDHHLPRPCKGRNPVRTDGSFKRSDPLAAGDVSPGCAQSDRCILGARRCGWGKTAAEQAPAGGNLDTVASGYEDCNNLGGIAELSGDRVKAQSLYGKLCAPIRPTGADCYREQSRARQRREVSYDGICSRARFGMRRARAGRVRLDGIGRAIRDPIYQGRSGRSDSRRQTGGGCCRRSQAVGPQSRPARLLPIHIGRSQSGRGFAPAGPRNPQDQNREYTRLRRKRQRFRIYAATAISCPKGRSWLARPSPFAPACREARLSVAESLNTLGAIQAF